MDNLKIYKELRNLGFTFNQALTGMIINNEEQKRLKKNARQAAYKRSPRGRALANYNAATARLRGYGYTPKKISKEEREQIIALYIRANELTDSGHPTDVDHIKPLVKGGQHTISNLQLLSREENQRKGAAEGTNYFQ